MNPWPFVFAAYGVAIALTVALLLWAYASMRRSEAAADALTRFLAGVDDLCGRFPDKTLALVGHGLTLSLYRAHVLGKPKVDLLEWQQLSFVAQAIVDPVAKVLVQDFQPLAGQIVRG